MYHFLYNSFEEFPGGRDYVGAHSTDDLYDGYMGSFSDKSFKPTARIIISFHPNRKALLEAEMRLQKLLNVVEDPQYANRAFQTSSGFSVLGAKFPGAGKGIPKPEKWKQARRGRGNPNYGNSPTPEVRLTMSLKKRGKNNPMFGKSGEESPTFGRVKTEREIESRREKMRQKRWFVNQQGETRMFSDHPPEGWKPGRTWEED